MALDFEEYFEGKFKGKRPADFIGFSEIGGIGQLIYHCVRFRGYEYDWRDNDGELIVPICEKDYPPDTKPHEYLTGQGILTSLLNLAKRVDDPQETTNHQELIQRWCLDNMHPYNIDSLYGRLTREDFDISGWDAKDTIDIGTFPIRDFMADLENLYMAGRFYIALERICVADNDYAYNLSSDGGRYFTSLPFFDRYREHHLEIPDGAIPEFKGTEFEKLLQEMHFCTQYEKEHPVDPPPEGDFAEEPYDDYDNLFKELISLFPDFKFCLKRNPSTGRFAMAADINSVFDIAWYTFARMITDDPPPEKKGRPQKPLKGILAVCPICGDIFTKQKAHQVYCDKADCQKKRNAKNQLEFRRRERNKKAHKNKKAPVPHKGR